MTGFFNNPIQTLLLVLSFFVAITVHECAHAWVSYRLGDPTAKLMGRLTLNPFKHLDLIGTLMIVFAHIGWAKPVMIDPFNLRNPKRDTAYISFAGPAANLLTAMVFSFLFVILTRLLGTLLFVSVANVSIGLMFYMLISLNVSLAVFNLIPIHPLDGYSVVGGFLSGEKAQQWQELRRYGIFFLLLLVFPFGSGPAPISLIITPITTFILKLLLPVS